MELQASHVDGRLHARHVGGIEETTIEFSPGVSILVGRNATNRTSFLRAVMMALGSEKLSLKGDAQEGEVELVLGDETYTRYLQRDDETVSATGDPYLDDPELADLFAFLLESNEARRAVATNADLRELIMRPVDTDEIQAKIDELIEERESLRAELDEIESAKGELPDLESSRAELKEEIDAKKAELEAKEAEIEAADTDLEETREVESELEETLGTLREKRSTLDDIRYDLETERESLKALKVDQRELRAEYDDLPAVPMGEIGELDTEIRRLRDQKQQLESAVNEVQSVIGFNQELLTDAGSSAFDELVEIGDELTEQLVDDDVVCWTCGSEVEQHQIEATLDRLRELSQTKVTEVNELDSEIEDLQSEKTAFEQAQCDRERVEDRLESLESEIETTEETLEDLKARREEVTEAVERAEVEVEELEGVDHSEILDLHKEANQLEYELGKLETDLDRVDSGISELEDKIASQDEVETQLEAVNVEIEDFRTKMERIEQGAVDHFNEHMDTVLDLLEYANLERIWIEPVHREVREGRRKVETNVFELHVVRTSGSGAAYEDTVEHLSESEREVTGLVFALAGYLAHEVYEEVPFILLDSLEAIDADRIAALVEHLMAYTSYLLVALLPEDTIALPDGYDRITEF